MSNDVIFVMGITGFIYLLGGKNKLLNKWVILFVLYLPFSIILSMPDSVFRSWQRLAFYYSVALVGLPLFCDDKAIQFRKKCLYIYLIFFVIIGCASFFCKFLGINLMVIDGENLEEFLYEAGKFSGIARHSMILGPVSGIASLFFTYKATKTRLKIFYIGTILCIGSVMFSASRGAFIATIIAHLYFIYKNVGSRTNFIRALLTILVLLTISFPLWKSALGLLEEKQAGNYQEYGILDSRTTKFKCRVQEFTTSPIYGIGFAAIDKNGRDSYKHETGVIEPGSSWLGILSQTGIIGFGLFLFLFIRGFKGVNSQRDPYCYLIAAMLIFMSIHMIVEGYVFAAGNPLCFFVMLLLGVCSDNTYDKKSEDYILLKVNQ